MSQDRQRCFLKTQKRKIYSHIIIKGSGLKEINGPTFPIIQSQWVYFFIHPAERTNENRQWDIIYH